MNADIIETKPSRIENRKLWASFNPRTNPVSPLNEYNTISPLSHNLDEKRLNYSSPSRASESNDQLQSQKDSVTAQVFSNFNMQL